ncbi:MAG: hypothetical protein H8E46_07780 [FCB group bacterium]|nr:hypothetical protein [FCB group bacterium]
MEFIWNINLLLSKLFDLILAPFSGIDPFWGLAVVSFITGAIMVGIFKFVSNQEGIRKAKARVRGYFLEVWLYKHEFGTVMGTIGRILKANFGYMKYAVSPLIVLMIPVILIMVQLNLHYGFYPLRPGETALMTVKFEDRAVLRDTTLIAEGSKVIKIDGTPVRAMGKNEATWRIKAGSPGSDVIRVTWNGGEAAKSVVVGRNKVVRLSNQRSDVGSLGDALFNPGEKPLGDGSGVVKITLEYPERMINLQGIEMHWLIVFFVLSIVAGFALKGVFKVEI